MNYRIFAALYFFNVLSEINCLRNKSLYDLLSFVSQDIMRGISQNFNCSLCVIKAFSPIFCDNQITGLNIFFFCTVCPYGSRLLRKISYFLHLFLVLKEVIEIILALFLITKLSLKALVASNFKNPILFRSKLLWRVIAQNNCSKRKSFYLFFFFNVSGKINTICCW